MYNAYLSHLVHIGVYYDDNILFQKLHLVTSCWINGMLINKIKHETPMPTAISSVQPRHCPVATVPFSRHCRTLILLS